MLIIRDEYGRIRSVYSTAYGGVDYAWHDHWQTGKKDQEAAAAGADASDDPEERQEHLGPGAGGAGGYQPQHLLYPL